MLQVFNYLMYMRNKRLYGGEGGIRTPGDSRLNGFQDRRFRPLSHLSEWTYHDDL
ncbi:hypothetical protein CCP3SC15_460018 [Gammaproteobacteria bacterium]